MVHYPIGSSKIKFGGLAKVWCGALLALPGFALPATAQAVGGTQEQSGEVTPDETVYKLAPVTVTARKKAELSRDVPISLTVIDGDTISDRNLFQVEDFVPYVPNFNQTNGSVGPLKYVRGAGSSSNTSFEQAVGTYIDNVYVGRGQQSRLPFFDLERIEFLRGPQVLVYGNSSTAGAVSVSTKKPGREFEADLSFSREFNQDEYALRGGVTIPLGDKFSVRVAGLYQDLNKGWLRSLNSFDGGVDQDPRYDNLAGRITLVGELSDSLRVTLKYEEADLNVRGNTLQSISNPLGNPAIVESVFDETRSIGQPAPLSVPEDRVDMKPTTLQAELVYDFGALTFTSLTAFTEYDYFQEIEGDLSPAPIFGFRQNEKYEQFSQEFRFQGKYADKLDYMFGVYYQSDELDATSFTDVNINALNGAPFPPFSRRAYILQDGESVSVFADLTYHVTDALRIGLGARYTDLSKDINQGARSADVVTGVLNPLYEQIVLPFPGNPSLYQFAFGNPHDFTAISRAEDHFQPQVLIQYDFNDDLTGFAKYVEGAKAGGVDWLYAGADPVEAQFEPETAKSYEAGVKARLLDGALNLDVTVFQTEFSDLQVSIFNGATNFVVANAASATSKGAELEGAWRASERLTLNASVGYLDATFDSFPNAGCSYEQRAVFVGTGPCLQDLAGRTTIYSSKWNGSAGIEYEQSLGEYVVTSRIDGNFRSKYHPGTVDLFQEGFVLLDARIEFSPADGDWFIAAFGKNLTDELYTEQVSDTPLITGSRFATLSRTRQLGLQAGIKF